MSRNFTDTPGGIPPGWMNTEDTIGRTGWRVSRIKFYVSKGRLTPKVKDGKNYYDPAEIDECINNPPSKSKEEIREEFAEYQLGVVRDIVGLVKDPREKIDEIQFKIIEKQRERIELLENKLDAAREATEAAKDMTAERNLAVEQVKSEGRIKEIAMSRMVDTVGKLIGGNNGIKFTPEQLEKFLIANDDGEEKFLTPEQEKQAKVEVAQWKAKTNGKAVVESAKKTVETVAEGMKAS